MTNILAIGAHPDDIEIGCLGFLLKAKKLGHRVQSIVLTRGGSGFSGTSSLRTEEGNKSAQNAGLEIIWGDFPDSKLSFVPIGEIEFFLAPIIALSKPSIILAPWKDDYHCDHIAVYQAVKKAAFLACRKEYTDVPWEPQQFLYYILGYRSFVKPDILVDISDVIDEKNAILSCHQSQDSIIKKYNNFNASYYVLNRGKDAEAFLVEEPLRLSSISDLI